MADGKPLAAGTYRYAQRLESPKPGAGQTPESERYVEFVRGGKVMDAKWRRSCRRPRSKRSADSKRQPAAGTSRASNCSKVTITC